MSGQSPIACTCGGDGTVHHHKCPAAKAARREFMREHRGTYEALASGTQSPAEPCEGTCSPDEPCPDLPSRRGQSTEPCGHVAGVTWPKGKCVFCALAEAERRGRRLYAALGLAMDGHSKQCMGYDYCRVCQTGGYDVLESEALA